MITRPIGAAALLLVAACGGSDDTTSDPTGPVDEPSDVSVDDASTVDDGGAAPGRGEPVAVVDVDSVAYSGPLFYEVSPDGERVAIAVDDVVCLYDLDEVAAAGDVASAAALACGDDPTPGTPVGRWSPDGRRFVVGSDTFRMFVAGPLDVIGVDGSVTTVAEPPADAGGERLDGAPFHPVFVDDETVAYGRVVDGDAPTFEVVTVGADGSGAAVVGTVPNPDPDEPWLPRWTWDVHDGDLSITMGGFGDPVSMWSFDLGSGDVTRIAAPPDPVGADRSPAWSLHDRAGDVALVVALDDLFSFGGSTEYPGWWVLDGAGGTVGLVVDPVDDEQYVRHAALSPDGATVAALAVSDDPDGVVRLATAPTADVLAGSPEWASVDLPAGTFGAADLGQSARALSWSDPGGLVLKSPDAVHRFTLD